MVLNRPPGSGRPIGQYIPQLPLNPSLGYPSTNIAWPDRLRELQQAQYLRAMQASFLQTNPQFARVLAHNAFGNTAINFPVFEPEQNRHTQPRPQQPHGTAPRTALLTAASPISIKDSSPIPNLADLSKEKAENIFEDSLRRLKADNVDFLDLKYWTNFTDECFSEDACYRHQYVSDSKDNHDFSADFNLLPFMLRIPYTCGASRIRFNLDTPSFISHDGLHQLKYSCCDMFTDYPAVCVKALSSLTVTFENDGKMLAWDFITFESEELISCSQLIAKMPISLNALNEYFRPKSIKLMQRLKLMRDITTVLTLNENMDKIDVESSDDEVPQSPSGPDCSVRYPTPREMPASITLSSAPKGPSINTSPQDQSTSIKRTLSIDSNPVPTAPAIPEPKPKKPRVRKPKAEGTNSKSKKPKPPQSGN